MAKGGAVFALHILHNASGNDQGMPSALPEVTGCGNIFAGNTVANAAGTDLDNPSTFGASLDAWLRHAIRSSAADLIRNEAGAVEELLRFVAT